MQGHRKTKNQRFQRGTRQISSERKMIKIYYYQKQYDFKDLHYIMIRYSVHQEDKIILNLHASNNIAWKHYMTELQVDF